MKVSGLFVLPTLLPLVSFASLISGRKVKDYSTAFYSLMNYVQVIYSIQWEMTFAPSRFDLFICNNTGRQTDCVHCIKYFLAYIYFILRRTDFQEINVPVKMRTLIHNRIQEHESKEDMNEIPEMTIAPQVFELNEGDKIFMESKDCFQIPINKLNTMKDIFVIIQDVMVNTNQYSICGV